MYCFDRIPPQLFALLATLLGILLTTALDENEQNSMGNFIVSIGQALLTNVSQAQGQQELVNNQNQLNDLSMQMDHLRNQIESLKKNYH